MQMIHFEVLFPKAITLKICLAAATVTAAAESSKVIASIDE